uniref:Uncharacterized protein n=1 Tax=Oryza brachyantha TaxID=4533 RepID=J3LRR1_ORYBR
MRRVHSAQELAGGSHSHPCFYDRRRQSCCCCRRRRDDHCAPLPPPPPPMRPLPSMSKNLRPAGVQEADPAVSSAKAVFSDSEKAMEKDTSQDVMVAMELDNRRACWEFE